MMTLYRAISQFEKADFDIDGVFRSGENTLEAKQFFKSKEAINEFVVNSVLQNYNPPYEHLLTIDIDKECFNATPHTSMILDGFDAISIHEDYLLTFTNCVIFVHQERI